MSTARILSHSLLECELSILRNRDSSADEFRRSLNRIAYHLCLAVTESLPLSHPPIETPIERTLGAELSVDLVLVPILRSGLTLLHAFSELVPQAKIGYVGLKRDEQSLEAKEYYCNIPALSPSTIVVVLDPMLATGGSMCATLKDLKSRGAHTIRAACVLAAPEGIARVQQEHPDVELVCAAEDKGLNAHGYIVPGLGDAGDRAHGTL